MIRKTAAFIVLTCLLLSGCTSYLYGEDLYYDGDTWDPALAVLNDASFHEDKSAYGNDGDEPDCLYLTVQAGRDEQLNKEYSFGYLKTYTQSELSDGEEPYCDVIMTEGTATESTIFGQFGFGEMTANGKLTIKGSVKKIKPRSFQIKLYDRAGLWEGVRTVNLIKNIEDLSRMRQKLCFDIVESLDAIGGMRARFVRLFVRDTTEGGNLLWEDMGIYTYVEQPNKAYLSAHGLDVNGTLYRAQNFTFEKNDALRSKTDELYDKDAFEEVLAIREAESHDKLLEMIDAVNREGVTAQDLIGKYFNEENLLTYCAVSILTGNINGFFEDYLLYSPENSQTFYFICEGFRDSFTPNGMEGYGFLLNNRLFRLYLSDKENRDKLDGKIREIRETVDDVFLGERLAAYKSELLKYLYSMPEITQLPASADKVEPYIDSLSAYIGAAAEHGVGKLSPYITSCVREEGGGKITFDRGEADYSVQISPDREFSSIVYDEITTDGVYRYDYAGIYYLRVKAVYKDGSVCYSSNIDTDYMGKTVYGGIEVE